MVRHLPGLRVENGVVDELLDTLVPGCRERNLTHSALLRVNVRDNQVDGPHPAHRAGDVRPTQKVAADDIEAPRVLCLLGTADHRADGLTRPAQSPNDRLPGLAASAGNQNHGICSRPTSKGECNPQARRNGRPGSSGRRGGAAHGVGKRAELLRLYCPHLIGRTVSASFR